MKWLIYCVIRDRKPLHLPVSHTPDGKEIRVARACGLAAVYSLVPESPPSGRSTISNIKSFARVVEEFMQVGTVVPMRFGCLLGSQSDAVRFLKEHRGQFRKSLREMRGCVEMGVSILLDAEAQPRKSAHWRTGAGYLRCRQSDFGQKDAALGRARVLAQRVRNAFNGLFIRFNADAPRPFGVSRVHPERVHREGSPRAADSGPPRALEGRPFGKARRLSLSFLIRSRDCEGFRARFRKLSTTFPYRMMLTGPWPPYTFAANAGTKND